MPPAVAGRLILSQAPDGSWLPSTTTAFALEARQAAEVAQLKPTLLSRIKDCISGAAEELEDGDGEALDDAVQGLRAEAVVPEAQAADEAAVKRATAAELEAGAKDCPLTFQVSAIMDGMPVRLAALQAARPEIDIARVWTTLCCVSALQRMNASWIWGDGDIYEERERTIVDAGREWVEEYARQHPALAAALADGTMRLAAKRATSAGTAPASCASARCARARPSPARWRSATCTGHARRFCARLLHSIPPSQPSSPSRWTGCSAGRCSSSSSASSSRSCWSTVRAPACGARSCEPARADALPCQSGCTTPRL